MVIVTIQPMRGGIGREVKLSNTATGAVATLHMFYLADDATNENLAESYADEVRAVLA